MLGLFAEENKFDHEELKKVIISLAGINYVITEVIELTQLTVTAEGEL